jgi:hypothetical protein
MAVLALAGVGVVFVAGLLFFQGWHWTVAACCGLLAVALLMANVRELTRD